MLEIRRYQSSDYDVVWNLHVSGLQNVGAYLGNGPWDNDLHHIESSSQSCLSASVQAEAKNCSTCTNKPGTICEGSIALPR